MKKIALILSGCGNKDGSELQESLFTMYAIMKNDAIYQLFAPDIMQSQVINHLTNEPMQEERNVLIEAARIARGNIKPLDQYSHELFDALIIPGGLGAAKNLSDYFFEGSDMHVIPQVETAIKDTYKAGKPIGALCIAPVILARVLKKVYLTMGAESSASKNIEQMGAMHRKTDTVEITVDPENKIVTTPCYMYDSNIVNIAEGTNKLVKAILEMTI